MLRIYKFLILETVFMLTNVSQKYQWIDNADLIDNEYYKEE